MRVHRVGAFPADVGEAATIPELIQVATHIARFDQDDVAVIVGVAGVFIAGIGIDQLIDLSCSIYTNAYYPFNEPAIKPRKK